ncbi:MAG: hypothetical protein AAF806_01910 [Bacteroidota bacterium]
MRTLKYFFGLTLIFLLASVTMNAQELQYRASTTLNTHANPLANIFIQDYSLSAGATPSSTNATSYQVEINAGSRTYGNTTGIYAYGEGDRSGSAIGKTRGWIAANHVYNSHGALVGVGGHAENVDYIRSNDSRFTAAALGGSFYTTINDPVKNDSGNEMHIAGSRSILDGTISTYPMNGVVAANYSIDKIKGTDTWAGYFDGRGHFSQNVGVNTTNPLSRLSVNGDGNSLYGAYITSTSQGNGSTGLRVEMPANTGFADQNVGVTSVIEAGLGYTTGVYGIATTATPSSDGRSYGVRGHAGNADVNFGLYGKLTGQNRGAALFAADHIKHPNYSEVISGNWAAYMVGDAHISDRLSIGTTNMPTNVGGHPLPNYKLYVCGGILANELLIPNVTWCDYVFEDDYELTALEDVKTHIEDKGYLHKTPSAETVESGGLKVADMTINQQEKIEEIFLHLIEMNEELKSLKAENEALKAEVKALK